jgi:AcrR family transcriptional regulator
MFTFEVTQRLKDNVRDRLLSGAASAFAELGVREATMAEIARRAGVAVGNVYRYFRGKEQLLAAVVPDGFARELRRMLARRVRALGTARDVRSLGPDSPYSVLSRRSLDYCIGHRERVAILLVGAEGTRLESFADELGRDLVRWSIGHLRRAYPGVRADGLLRFALERIYDDYVAALGHALTRYTNEPEIRRAVEHLSAYHLGGLQRLFEQCEMNARRKPRPRRKSQ